MLTAFPISRIVGAGVPNPVEKRFMNSNINLCRSDKTIPPSSIESNCDSARLSSSPLPFDLHPPGIRVAFSWHVKLESHSQSGRLFRVLPESCARYLARNRADLP